MPVLAKFGHFWAQNPIFWAQGVKILVPSYQDSNETPFSCWKHIHIHISWIGTSLIHASWTRSYCTHLHVTHCLSARNSNWCRSTLVPRILSQLLCEYLFYVNQLSGKIFDIGHLTLGLVLLSYLLFVIFFTRAKFLENKIYTEKQQFFALNL